MTTGNFLFITLAGGIVGACIISIVARFIDRKESK